jgi:hypothetical protein
MQNVSIARLRRNRTGIQCCALFVLTLVLPITGFTAGLNDTGITELSESTYGQDGNQGRDALAATGNLIKVGGGNAGFDFTKIANDGSELPVTAALGNGAADWACTRDNVTGLIWEVKTTGGLRSISHTYSWYDSSALLLGYESFGSCYIAGRCDTEKFVQDVNTAGLCGSKSWRMPTIKELESISDMGISPAIDPTYFPNSTIDPNNSNSSEAFRSATYSTGNVGWCVSTILGNASLGCYLHHGKAVRLVRGVP